MKHKDAVVVLGGGHAIKPGKYSFQLDDGKNIVVTVSKRYTRDRPYWYGLSPSFLKAMEANKCSHVAFGMGSSQVALVPSEIVKNYVKYCSVSKYKTQEIHHYHFFITNSDTPEMYVSQDSPRTPLMEYITKVKPQVPPLQVPSNGEPEE